MLPRSAIISELMREFIDFILSHVFCLNAFALSEAEENKCLNSELWHACAGPLVSLPAVGSRVVYFPQGHGEQVTLLPWTSNFYETIYKYCIPYLGAKTVKNVSLMWSWIPHGAARIKVLPSFPFFVKFDWTNKYLVQVAASTNKEMESQIPNYPSLPPQLICQLHNVTMHVSLEL